MSYVPWMLDWGVGMFALGWTNSILVRKIRSNREEDGGENPV